MIGLPSDSWNHLGRKRTSRGIFAPLSATQVEAMDVDGNTARGIGDPVAPADEILWWCTQRWGYLQSTCLLLPRFLLLFFLFLFLFILILILIKHVSSPLDPTRQGHGRGPEGAVADVRLK